MRKLLLFIALIAALLPELGRAQTSPLIIDQNRVDRMPRVETPAPSAPLMQAQGNQTPQIAPFVLREVRVQGTSLAPKAIDDATRLFIGQTVDSAGIQRIADALAGSYAKSNIALYTITAPAQDLADGVLILAVTEGYIAKVEIKDEGKHDTSLIARYGAKLTRERPLTRATLQRYVTLIRNIPGLKAELQLLAAGPDGATILSIAPKQQLVQFGVNFNNSGSPVLGRYQVETDATLFSLLREGESTRVTFAAPTDFGRFQYYALSDSEPLDDEGTVAQVSGGFLNTHPEDSPVHGQAETLQFLATRPLLLNFQESLYATLGLDGLDSNNAVIGDAIANERVRAVRAAIAYADNETAQAYSVSGTASFGIDGLGAEEPSPLLASSNFVKFNGTAAFSRQLAPEWYLRLRAAGQYGASRLPISELYAVGGPDFGRAFDVDSIIGDSGIAGSAEIAWRPDFLAGMLAGSELYGFGDHETTWLRARALPGQSFNLASAGLGTRIAVSAKTFVQIEAARVMDAPAAVARIGGWHLGLAITGRY